MKQMKLEQVDETDKYSCNGCWFNTPGATSEEAGCPRPNGRNGLVCTITNSIWVLKPVKERAMKHKVLDHCIECNQLKRKIEEMANTIRFEAERANREQEQNKVLRDSLDVMCKQYRATHGLDGSYNKCIIDAEQALKDTE